MEISRRETFDQLRINRRQVRLCSKNTFKDLKIEKMKGKRRGSSSERFYDGDRRRNKHEFGDGGRMHNSLPQR